MRALEMEELVRGLRSALDAGGGDALETAELAGLLARHPGAPAALLGAAERWRDGADALDAALAALPIEAAVDRLLDDGGGDALAAVDELCAGAAWCDAGFRVAAAVDLAARAIEAFPEAWRELAPLATRLLIAAPPLARDPARLLWTRVEAARWPIGDALPAPPCSRAVAALGLRAMLSLSQLRPAVLPAASDALPAAPPWHSLAAGDRWELAATILAGEPIIILAAVAGVAVSAERGGNAVALAPVRPGVWSCPALPGEVRFTVGDEIVAVEVAP